MLKLPHRTKRTHTFELAQHRFLNSCKPCATQTGGSSRLPGATTLASTQLRRGMLLGLRRRSQLSSQVLVRCSVSLKRNSWTSCRQRRTRSMRGVHTVRLHQRVGGVRIAYLDVVVALMSDGALMSIDGRLRAPRAQTFRREPEDVLAVVTANVLFAETRITESSVVDGFAVYRSGERYTVEPVFDPVTRSNAWLIVDRAEPVEYIVVDSDLSIARVSSLADSVVGACAMTRFAFPRDGGFATTIDTGSTTGSCPATETDSAFCEATNFFGTCTWELRHEEFITQDIRRVIDDDGSEVSRVTACPVEPTFGGCNSNNLRQQTAFWAVEQMRAYMSSYV